MEAFEEIVKDCSPRIYYFLRRIGLDHEDADEIVQDVFILLWRDLKSGHGLSTVDLRLYKHAINNALSFLNNNGNPPLAISSVKAKLVLVLKHQEGLDFEDIAEVLGWNVPDVRNSFKSALNAGGS